MKNLSIFSFLFLILFFAQCKNEKAPLVENKLGTIHISYSGNEAAQKHFEKGLLLMHNFEYDDSRKSFLKAQEVDSTMVMAYWGEAMTYNHPLWREQEYENGQAALQKLGVDAAARKAKIPTELEADFFNAVEILYGEGAKKDRDVLYSNHLKKLYQKYPKNEEIAAFYALSCLGAVPLGRDEVAYERGANVVKGILAENPNHPGALHYMIHAYDDPGHAVLALEAANSYSKVAADATHALHMPSHIYIAVGMWDEVISCNIASYEASVKKMKAAEKGNDARGYHALHWLLYAHLQKGQYKMAEEIMSNMASYTLPESKKRTRSHLYRMKSAFLAETGDWDHAVAEIQTERSDLGLTDRATYLYLEGNKAFQNEDKAALSELIQELGQEIAFAETLVTEGGLAMCQSGGASRYKPNQVDIDHARVMELELRALRSWKDKEAEKWLKQAADLEQQISYSFGPPIISQPAAQLYGQWLLTQKQAEAALAQFEKALERGPKRTIVLKGKLAAFQMAGDEEKAKAVQAELQEILKEGDADVKKQFNWQQNT